MKVLISCYACSPYKGSEPGMGWNFVKCLSKMHELHIITESKFKLDLDRYFSDFPEERQYYRFYYIQKERHKKLRKIWPPSYYWFYRNWQEKALALALELDKEENFDIVHQLNMVGFREPGYLWKLHKPLVWGPVGGMHLSPWCLLPHIGIYGMLYYSFRNILNLKDIYFKKSAKLMAMQCNSIIAATQDAHDTIQKVWGKDSVIVPEVGLLDANTTVNVNERIGKMKIAWSGQHTPAKALNFLIEAVACCKHKNDVELHVLGVGKYTNRWKASAKKKGLENIAWYGWMERAKAIEVMRGCHLFCITSMADLTSTVLLEALSYGLPVVAMNRFGFANTITNDCGIKIDIHTKKQVVQDFAAAIDLLYENENKRQALSKGAFERAKDFSWDKKAEMINDIYKNLIQ